MPTPRQQDLLRSLERLTRERGYTPSVRELAEDLGLASTNSVASLVEALLAEGLILKTEGRHRSLRLSAEGHKHL